MKLKTVTLILTTCAMTATSAFATIWRVNNNPPGNLGDFTTLQAAHDGAAAGDTLYLAGSATSYGSLTATKTLFIFGTGYFLTQIPETQANLNTATISSLTFNSGSEGSVIKGLVIGSIATISADNIAFQRNQVTANNGVQINGSNVIFSQNYVSNTRLSVAGASVLIFNNFIQGDGNWSISGGGGGTTFIQHNVLDGLLSISNANLNDNILRSGNFTGANNIFTNNIGNATQFGTANGNQSNVDLSTVFVGATGNSTDGQWQIQPGSAAEGTGTNGVDIGMFGGPTPYVLSGLPEIPAIYFFNGPLVGSASTGLQIQVKIKSHN